MSITVSYGTFSFTSDEPEVQTAEEFVFSQSGARERRTVRINVTGHVQGTAPVAGAESIRSAFLADDQTFAVVQGTTAISHLTFAGSDCIRGPKVRSFSFPESTGPEMATGGRRTYALEIELEQELASPTHGDVTEFRETVTWFDGSIPNYQVLETIEGTAEIWKTGELRAYRVTQSGEAVGRRDWPPIPEPKWPSKLIQKDPIEYTSPEYLVIDTEGKVSAARMYRARWRYEFADSTADLLSNWASRPSEWVEV